MGPLRCAGPSPAVNAASRRLQGRCPARFSAAAVSVVWARLSPTFLPALPRSSLPDLGCPDGRALGTLAVLCRWAHRGLGGIVWAALRISPVSPPPYPVPLLEPRPPSRPAQSLSCVPCGRSRAAALHPSSPVPSPLDQAPARSVLAGRGPRWSRNVALPGRGEADWARSPAGVSCSQRK